LGLPQDASAEQVKRAYYQLALTLHPDRHPDSPDAVERFTEVGAAYTTILGDESVDKEERRKAKAAAGQPAEMPDEVAFTKAPPPKLTATPRAQAVTLRAQAAAPRAQPVAPRAQTAAPCVQAVATCTQAPHVDAFPSWAGRLAAYLHHLGGERLDAWLMPSYARIIYKHVRPRAERAALVVPPLAAPAA
tara:strand:- start:202 stop:771 length:570 start_codon:yes stop_codon:yes gene_type:complete